MQTLILQVVIVTMWMFTNGGSQLALKFGLQFITLAPRGCGCLKVVASFKMNNMFYTLNPSNPFTYVSVDASNASLLHCFQFFFFFVFSYDLTLLKKKLQSFSKVLNSRMFDFLNFFCHWSFFFFAKFLGGDNLALHLFFIATFFLSKVLGGFCCWTWHHD